MSYVLIVIFLVLAGYFGVRYFLLKRSLRKVNDELREVTESLGENRIVKLPSPDKDIETILETINVMLEEIRKDAVEHARRERALRSQIESISHDLRTPLTSIQGYLSLISVSELDNESVEALEVVRKKSDSLQRLIVQFYELSQLEHENEIFDLHVRDVAYLLKESLAAHYQMLSESGLEVELKIPETSVEALVEDEALERILANLLENASRYALSTVEIELKETTKHVQILFSNDCTLTDDIEPEELFVPFYVGHRSRPQGSSGLGLPIARQLAEKMNGSLEAAFDQAGEDQTLTLVLSLELF